jgi:hypothetical protein
MFPRSLAVRLGCGAVALAALARIDAGAVPLSPDELAGVCAQAEGTAHCGRLVEAVQLKRLPNLAIREGATLKVSLFPSGIQVFADSESLTGGRTYSLWDFLSEINAVVLYTTEGDDAGFVLLQRATGRRVDLPADPKLAPDRARLVTADFCAARCSNELSVWRVSRDGVRKELAFKPAPPWKDATASWVDADTVAVEYTATGAGSALRLERRLSAPDWVRVGMP